MWTLFTRFGLRVRLRRGALALGLIVLVWLLVSLPVAYRLTHRPRPRFEEPAPRVTWGPLENHRIKTSDGEELGLAPDGSREMTTKLASTGPIGISSVSSLNQSGVLGGGSISVITAAPPPLIFTGCSPF